MSEVTLWSAVWCAPCGPLKAWVAEHYPNVLIKDIEEGAPNSIKSLPALETFDKEIITGARDIRMYLAWMDDEEWYR